MTIKGPELNLRILLSLAFLFLLLALGLYLYTRWQSGLIEAGNPPLGRFVEIDGGRLHYGEVAPAGAPRATVLLLHGATGNHANMLVPLGAPLAAAGFRVIAIDRPGHGWSDRIKGRDAASPAVQATLIVAAMRKLGVGRAIVVGHSLAGVVATNLALNHQDFTQALVLVSPVTHPWPGGVAAYYTVSASPVAGWLFNNLLALPAGRAFSGPATASVFAPDPVPPGFAAATQTELVLRPREFGDNAQEVAALYDFVVTQAPRLPQIKAPTAIVSGDSDTVVLTHIHSYGSARDIPGATLKILQGVGHAPQFAHAREVVAAVEEVAGR